MWDKLVKTYVTLFNLLTLLLIAGLLVWLGQFRYDDFQQSQAAIAQSAVLGVANQIRRFNEEQKRRMQVFSAHQQAVLQNLAKHPQDSIHLQDLQNKIAAYFPDALGFALLCDDKRLLLDSLARDSRELPDVLRLKSGASFSLRIEDYQESAFFSLHTAWQGPQNGGTLLLRFSPEKLLRMLKDGSPPGYQLLLLHSEPPHSIELIAQDARALRDGDSLSAEAAQRVLYHNHIDDSEWNLVALHPRQMFSAYQQMLLNQGLLVLFVFSAIFLALWLFTYRAEQRRTRAERALQASEARYRAIIEDQTELICRFRPDGRLSFVNQAYCRYFQHDADELLDHSALAIVFPEQRQQVLRALRRLKSGAEFVNLERNYSAPHAIC